MTSSEQRLHPASILFDIARYARLFAWPALLAWMGGQRRESVGNDWMDTSAIDTWLWVLILPSVGLSVVRFLTFRVQYEPDELVIRSGLLFRNVRHVPYARIQNLDVVQNVFHRALGVVDVRIETGSGGSEPEGRLNVLPASVVDGMRTRIFAGRAVEPHRGVVPDQGLPSVHVQGLTPVDVLHLGWKDLLLLGFLENKGMVLIGAAYGVVWEAGLMDWLWGSLFDDTLDARGLFREVAAFVVGRGPLPLGRLGLAVGALAGFLVLVRLMSMAWAVLRLWDFRLTRSGDDLRLTYGLFTQVSATIPARRVQAVIVHRGWLHRWLERASIRVETAGGAAGAATRDREWLAPILPEQRIASVLGEVLPGTTVDDAWHPVHPRAFRRAVKPALATALAIWAALAAAVGWRSVVVAAPILIWTVVATRGYVRHLAWQVTESLVAFRSGWLSRSETLVRLNRVQSVTLRASPFDRRAGMARVSVDTAGAGEFSHRVAIPYLAEMTAQGLRQQLAAAAARTAFRW